MTELQLQAQCTQWFWNTYAKHRGRLRRVKNELDNHPYKTKQDIFKQLSENKATGVIPGDSDLYFIAEKNTYIELKIPGGRQGEEQKKFEALVTQYGHHYVLVWSLQEFKNLIIDLLNGT